MNKQQHRRLLNVTKMAALGGLTGGVAHEFNNVLAIVSGNLQLITEMFGDEINDEMDGMMQDALTAAERGAEMVSGLLALSRPQETETSLIDVNEFVGNFAELIRRTLGGRISISVALEDDVHFVQVDENEFSIALLHLALNARHAMLNGGQLSLRTSSGAIEPHAADDGQPMEAAACVIIEVSDTGCGMSADVRNRATDAFFTTKRLDEGGGLGLSVVTDFVKSAEGDLCIKSTEGAGTTIAIQLPARTRDM